MKKLKVNRLAHVGKDRFEKEAYLNFLNSEFSLDKTEEDPLDLNKTDSSSVEEDGSKPDKVTKKSFRLKVKDFFRNNLIIGITGSLIAAALIGVFAFYVNTRVAQEKHSEKINNIEQDIGEIKEEAKENKDNINKLDSEFKVFKNDASKDIDYIMRILKL